MSIIPGVSKVDIDDSTDRKIIRLTSSSLNEFSLCPTRYYYWEPLSLRMMVEPKPLSRGSIMHEILRVYYETLRESQEKKVQFDHVLTVEKAIEHGRFYGVQNGAETDTISETIERCKLYFDYYYGKLSWEIKAVEIPFSKPLYEDKNLLVLYEGQIDLIGEHHQKGPFNCDHKSESRKSDPIFYVNQFCGYSWATDTTNFLVNKVGFQSSIKDKDKLFRQYWLEISEEKQQEWVQDTMYWVHHMLSSYEKGYWPKNRTSCDKYGRCPYLKICESDSEKREEVIRLNYRVGESHDPMRVELGETDE